MTIASKIKYSRINIPKEVKDRSTENCKTLIKEIAENTNMFVEICGKTVCAHGLEKLILFECPHHAK